LQLRFYDMQLVPRAGLATPAIARSNLLQISQWDACGRGFPDNIVPLSIPVLVVSSSVSSAIRFLFSDLTCFIVENLLTPMYV